MRRRAYRPEVPGCLEERSLFSGVAGLAADPVVLPRLRFIKVVEHTRLSFKLLVINRDVEHLREELRDFAVIIPFGRVDGLGVSINRIVDRLEEDLSANVPHAIRSASNDVVDATRAQVKARVKAGDVVVR